VPRVSELTGCGLPVGTRIRVTGVYEDRAERNGYVKDQQALHGRTGRARLLTGVGPFKQLHVEWDEPGTSLSLCALDTVEIIR
jgi:hypothetical protein